MWYTVDRKISPVIKCVGWGLGMHDCIKAEGYGRSCGIIWLCGACGQRIIMH